MVREEYENATVDAARCAVTRTCVYVHKFAIDPPDIVASDSAVACGVAKLLTRMKMGTSSPPPPMPPPAASAVEPNTSRSDVMSSALNGMRFLCVQISSSGSSSVVSHALSCGQRFSTSLYVAVELVTTRISPH